jgi:DNA-binding LacI/PurR family transcriptional regulator
MLVKIASFIDENWKVAVGSIGALLLAAPTFVHIEPGSWISDLLFGAGALLSIWGGVIASTAADEYRRLKSRVEVEEIKSKSERDKRLFVVFSSFTEDWQAELNNHLITSITNSGFRAEVFCPSKSYSEGEYRRILVSVLSSKDQYSGGIMISSLFPDLNLDEIFEFTEKLGLPTVLLDYGSIDRRDTSSKIASSRIAWISVRDGLGGRLAAEAAARIRPSARRALVIAGPGKHQRHEEFKSRLRALVPDCSVLITEDGRFDRVTAEDVATSYFHRAAANGNPFDIVFCTADSMTLGCIDAIRGFGWQNVCPPSIIGYDGVEATKRLALDDQNTLAKIVIQDSERLAGLAIRELRKLQAGAASPIVCWVEPHLFPTETE